MVHSIRLRRAWYWEPVRAGEGVSFVRRFGKPTGLSATDRVVLVIVEAMGPGRALLNEELVGQWSDPHGGLRCDVTKLLQPRNQLQLDFDSPPDWHSTSGPVEQPNAAEIEPATVRLEIHTEPPSEYDGTADKTDG